MNKELRQYMSRIGKRGGKRRLITMTSEERSERARQAVQVRWAKLRCSTCGKPLDLGLEAHWLCGKGSAA